MAWGGRAAGGGGRVCARACRRGCSAASGRSRRGSLLAAQRQGVEQGNGGSAHLLALCQLARAQRAAAGHARKGLQQVCDLLHLLCGQGGGSGRGWHQRQQLQQVRWQHAAAGSLAQRSHGASALHLVGL
jgi:hypothetical protein